MPVTLGLVTAGIGAAQGIAGFFQGKKARKQLENLQTPTYTPSKSITDYYNEAQRRYQESPYQSNLYKMQAQNIARGTAQGIAGLQDRRSALAGISGLVQGQNDALLKAGVAAEQQQNQRFGQLGAASQAMGAEQRQAFNINQMMPYQKQLGILNQKAAGGAQLMNAGLQNVYGGLTGAMYMSGLSGNRQSPSSTPQDYDPAAGDHYMLPSSYRVPLASY
jgi:hypothetical protein